MGTKVNSNYEDLITFTRASNGHALRPVSYGDELVTNGTFDSDSDWTKSANSTISGGKATVSITSGAFEVIEQPITYKVGAMYRVTATVNGTSGNVIRFQDDTGNSGGLRTPNSRVTLDGNDQEISFIWVTNGNSNVMAVARDTNTGTYSFTVDNVSVKEIIFDQPDGTLTLFEHPNNIPRVEWDADGNRLGLLVEEARTNLNPRSRPDSNWIASNVTLAENDSTAPDGTESATKITETTATSSHYTYAPAASFTIGTTYTISCFVKAGTKSLIQLTGSSGPFGGGLYANFDVENGTVGSTGSGTTATIQDVGNGWYRCVVTGDAIATAGASTSGVLYMIESLTAGRGPSFTGSTSNYLYAYGLQLEQASFPTSYIKTTGATATRAADLATLSFDNFGHNKKEMTLLVDFDYRAWQYTSQYPRVVGLGRTTSSTNANFGVFNDGANEGTLRYRVDNSSGAAVLGAANLSGSDGVTSAKVALAIKEGQHAITYNGNTPIPSTGGDPELETVDIIAIGARWAEAAQQAADYMNGHIKSIQYYPRRLTNAQLQDITS